jgi:glucan-binding YG repeat protein
MKKLNNIIKSILFLLSFVIVISNSGVLVVKAADEKTNTKIHFISLYATSDAILLESDGHFGLVDSGEDWDYPNSSQYPLRNGTTTKIGYDQQVIHYLRDVCGVKKLDFYIATHSHSDHIGTADEIMNEFKVDRLYINKYDDSYISSKNNLWDNKYVYDCLINKAEEKNVRIITDLDLRENAQYRNFNMGVMNISIMNYERDRDVDGNIIPTNDENDNSLTVLVQANGKNAFLSSDIELEDTAKLANQLVDKLWDSIGIDKEGVNLTVKDVADNEGIEQNNNTNISGKIDDSVANTGKRIQIDLLKLPHHGLKSNYSRYFLTSLNPKNVVVTGPKYNFDSDMKQDLPNAKVYSTYENAAAIVADFSTDAFGVSLKKTEPGYYSIDGRDFYFDNCARLSGWNRLRNDNKWYFFIKGNKTYGWLDVDGKMYFMDTDGVMQTGWQNIWNSRYYFTSSGILTTGWQNIGNKWYYMSDNGAMAIGWKYINGQWYYMNTSGVMATGWQCIDGQWYYMNVSGAMATGWQYINGYWYYMDRSGAMVTGSQDIGNILYYFRSDGSMITGWYNLGEYWYYLNENGIITTGWQNIDGKWYYMDTTGVMTTGWQYIDDQWYYMNASGTMTTGWQYFSGKWYYMNISGAMATGWQYIDDQWYYLNEDGTLLTNAI